MTEGDVVLTPLPQADGQIKNRPAIILREMPPCGDFLVCGVSTQLHQEVAGFDDPIRPGDADFAASGLKAPSLIRLGFLAVLPASSLLGAIGSIEKVRHVRLLKRLSNHLHPTAVGPEGPLTAD
jgi:mRNA interferase MazF